MGIADYDVNGDGYPDYYLTSQADNRLQTLTDGPDQPAYQDIALELKALATNPYTGDTSLPSTAWHSEFQDVNNDGRMDLFVSKGNVDEVPDYALNDPSDLMLRQPDGTFMEAGQEAGIDSPAKARGAAVIDLNNDGLLDLVIVDRVSNVRVYRNVGTGTADAPREDGQLGGPAVARGRCQSGRGRLVGRGAHRCRHAAARDDDRRRTRQWRARAASFRAGTITDRSGAGDVARRDAGRLADGEREPDL